MLNTLPRFFDAELAELCVDLLENVERLHIYPDPSGPLPKLFALMHEADGNGIISRVFFGRTLKKDSGAQSLYYIDEVVVSLMPVTTAQWLLKQNASGLIKRIAPYCRGEVRELFRPHSDGWIDAQDARSKAYVEEESLRQDARSQHISTLQGRLFAATSLNEALGILWELKEDYWPELPNVYRDCLATEVSKALLAFNLEANVRWEGTALWEPPNLRLVMKVIDRFALKIEPDEPLIFAITGLDTGIVARYHNRYPLSEAALATILRLLASPPSSQALAEIIRFLESSQIWSDEIARMLRNVASDGDDRGYLQVTSLRLLFSHSVENAFLAQIADASMNAELRSYAFNLLVDEQDRPTIERALARLTDDDLKNSDASFPDLSSLAWITRIKEDFAWNKLVELRARSLRLELPMLMGTLTEALAKIDRAKAARVIRTQLNLAPESWRIGQTRQAIEQERQARIEAAQRTPFENVLEKLRGATSINFLKLLCEGITDRPIFRSLLDQTTSTPNIIIQSVGGWSGLIGEPDPNLWLLGAKEAIMILDGDQGRYLTKRNKPESKLTKDERKRLAAFPVKLHVLERYGIENYFPQHALEKVLHIDLSAYFPVPHHTSVTEALSLSRRDLWFKFKKLIATSFGFQQPTPKRSLYSKKLNIEAARYLDLKDIEGTDLMHYVHEISNAAGRLLNE